MGVVYRAVRCGIAAELPRWRSGVSVVPRVRWSLKLCSRGACESALRIAVIKTSVHPRLAPRRASERRSIAAAEKAWRHRDYQECMWNARRPKEDGCLINRPSTRQIGVATVHQQFRDGGNLADTPRDSNEFPVKVVIFSDIGRSTWFDVFARHRARL